MGGLGLKRGFRTLFLLNAYLYLFKIHTTLFFLQIWVHPSYSSPAYRAKLTASSSCSNNGVCSNSGGILFYQWGISSSTSEEFQKKFCSAVSWAAISWPVPLYFPLSGLIKNFSLMTLIFSRRDNDYEEIEKKYKQEMKDALGLEEEDAAEPESASEDEELEERHRRALQRRQQIEEEELNRVEQEEPDEYADEEIMQRRRELIRMRRRRQEEQVCAFLNGRFDLFFALRNFWLVRRKLKKSVKKKVKRRVLRKRKMKVMMS